MEGIRRLARATCLACLGAVLSACGGGGSGSGGQGNPNPPPPPPPPPPPTLSLLTFGPQDYHRSAGIAFSLVETAFSVGINSAISFDLRVSAGTAPVTNSCTQSGSIIVSLNDDDTSGGLSVGDRIVLTYSSCNDGTSTANALINIDVLTATNVGGEQRVTMRTTVVNFTDTFPNQTLTLSGSVDVEWRASIDSDRFLVSGTQLVITTNTGSDTLRNFTAEYSQNYAAYEFVMTMAGEVHSGTLGGRFNLETNVPYHGRLGFYPTAGAVTFRGASNSAYRLEEGAGGETGSSDVGVSSDFDGDGIFEFATGLGWFNMSEPDFFEPVRANVPVPPESPGIHDLVARVVPLVGGLPQNAIADIEVDNARARLYASARDRNEIIVVSTATWQVIDRIAVGSRPTALDLGADGMLFVTLNRGGAVAQVNPDTRAVTRIDIAVAMNISQPDNVVEAAGRLYVTPRFVGQGETWLVEVNRAAGNPMKRVGGPLIARQAEMVASNDGRFLYLAQPTANGSRLHKIDLALADAPVVLTRDFTGITEDTTRLALSPDGARLVLRSGEVLSTATFTLVARVPAALDRAFMSDGSTLGSLGGPGFVMHHAAQMITQRTMPLTCPGMFEPRVAYVASTDQWVATTREGICVFDVNDRLNPPGQAGGPPLPTDPQPTNLNVSGNQVLTAGGTGASAAVIDPTRGYVYVAGLGPAAPEFAVFSTTSNTVVHSSQLSLGLQPLALSLNDDGSRLFLGHVGSNVTQLDVFNPAALAFIAPVPYPQNLIDNAPGSGMGSLSDVGWIGNNKVLLAPMGNRLEAAAIVSLNVTDGTAFQIAGGQKKFYGDTTLHVVPDKTAAILAGRPGGSQRLQRIDLVPNDPDVVADRDHMELQGADHGVLSTNGEVLHVQGGAAVNTRTLMLVGERTPGLPVLSTDGSELFVLGPTDESLQVFDATTFQLRARYTLSPCGPAGVVAAMRGPNPREIVYVKSTYVCRVVVPAS